jgi:hypothetical protein
MTCAADTQQIDLRFGDPMCNYLDLNGSVRSGNLSSERLRLFT